MRSVSWDLLPAECVGDGWEEAVGFRECGSFDDEDVGLAFVRGVERQVLGLRSRRVPQGFAFGDDVAAQRVESGVQFFSFQVEAFEGLNLVGILG